MAHFLQGSIDRFVAAPYMQPYQLDRAARPIYVHISLY